MQAAPQQQLIQKYLHDKATEDESRLEVLSKI